MSWCHPRLTYLATVVPTPPATPGIHYPESRCYIRRVRVSAHSELVKPLAEAGFDMEPAVEDPDNTVVVSFPVDVGEGVRTCVAHIASPLRWAAMHCSRAARTHA